MPIDFWPTLQIRAYASLAQAILYTFNLEFLKERSMAHMNVYPTLTNAIEEKVNQRIIPTVVQKKLVGVVMSLAWEVYKWFDCHEHFFPDTYLDLRNKLHWFSFGIIDRLKTARNFIQDVNLNIRERFHLARKYCLQEDVHILWTNMSPDHRLQETYILMRNGAIEIWLQTLDENVPLDWEELSSNERPCFFFGYKLGLRSYFAKLRGSEARYECFYFALKSKRVHHFDLYSCLCQINANDELIDVLTRLPGPQFSEVLQIFLHWPFQNMFLDVVTSFQGLINKHIFYDLVDFLLYKKLEEGWHDHPYEKLFVVFWELFSGYEAHVREDEDLYKVVEYVLENYENFDRSDYASFVNSVI
ncbi:uncharacterized protein TNCT_227171 [Trichonephila clavata]|uniref:Uncharacterized protein n=1 Tax=Trichonephila clavata TaxID=2740835 RepID=A0A8X6H0V5_TRICU|nr:uncharacterized protein TNCT_227171 [Trichonephila clavata]